MSNKLYNKNSPAKKSERNDVALKNKKLGVLNYVDKITAGKKPIYPSGANASQIDYLAKNLERQRDMTGEIGRSKHNPIVDFKIDISGISNSVNNYINASKIVAPPKKQRNPGLSLGLGSILGESYDI